MQLQIYRRRHQRSARRDLHHLAPAHEAPGREHAARKTVADAGVLQQVGRMLGRAVRRKVARRCGGHEALRARAQRHGDHVARNALVVADARIETGCEHVDEGVVGRHLERDAGVRDQEAAGQRRQHALRNDRRHVEPQCAGGAVAKAVERVERTCDVVERRGDPVQQPLPGFGGRDAAGGAVQEPHAQLRLEPAHGFAERGGRHAAQCGRATKAACTRDGDKGAEVRKVGIGHGAIVRFSAQPVRAWADYRTHGFLPD